MEHRAVAKPAITRKPPTKMDHASWVLLAVGLLLLIVPIAIAAGAPEVLIRAEFYLRVATALGGGLVAAFVPGALQINLPGIRGAGALAIFALIFSVNPPKWGADVGNPLTPSAAAASSDATSTKITKWLFPNARLTAATGELLEENGKPAALDPARLAALRDWLRQNGLDIPIVVFLRSETLSDPRIKATTDLNIR
jgi:hypothetical protein